MHGITDAGPLDVYVDGSLALIGILFADISGDVVLAGGEHAFAVVPTGGHPRRRSPPARSQSATTRLPMRHSWVPSIPPVLGSSRSTIVLWTKVGALPDHQRRARRRSRSPRFSRVAMPCQSLLDSGTLHSMHRSTPEPTTWISSRPPPEPHFSHFRKRRLRRERRPT